MSISATSVMAPDAVLFLEAPCMGGDPPGPKLYFFKNRQYLAWDVVAEKLCEGYPRDAATDWPGLFDVFPGRELRGALQVPEWQRKVFFFFSGQSHVVVWDLERHAVVSPTIPIGELLPGGFTRQDFTPVYAQLAGGQGVIYGFRGHDYARWSVGSAWPASPESGFPHKIADDWKDGLVLAPRTGVYVEWPSRSSAHSNRKIYFFMGDLYLRWDVPSDTRNYRLDIVAGWKGWPRFG
jgi:hypothetical protein